MKRMKRINKVFEKWNDVALHHIQFQMAGFQFGQIQHLIDALRQRHIFSVGLLVVSWPMTIEVNDTARPQKYGGRQVLLNSCDPNWLSLGPKSGIIRLFEVVKL